MNLTHVTSIILDMSFGSLALFKSFIREIQRGSALRQNVLCGRVAPDGAWMRLELRGDPRRIGDLVGRWRESIVTPVGEPELAA
jgi:hypothetical protein